SMLRCHQIIDLFNCEFDFWSTHSKSQLPPSPHHPHHRVRICPHRPCHHLIQLVPKPHWRQHPQNPRPHDRRRRPAQCQKRADNLLPPRRLRPLVRILRRRSHLLRDRRQKLRDLLQTHQLSIPRHRRRIFRHFPHQFECPDW